MGACSWIRGLKGEEAAPPANQPGLPAAAHAVISGGGGVVVNQPTNQTREHDNAQIRSGTVGASSTYYQVRPQGHTQRGGSHTTDRLSTRTHTHTRTGLPLVQQRAQGSRRIRELRREPLAVPARDDRKRIIQGPADAAPAAAPAGRHGCTMI